MQKAYYPVGLLNSVGIAALSVEHKMLLAGTAVHKAMLACGVIPLTDCVLISLGFIPSVGLSIAADLARRGLAVFDESSRFFFALGFYRTNLTPSEAGQGSPWAKNVESSLREVKKFASAGVVAEAAREAIDQQDRFPEPKWQSVGTPTNLLTALPRSGCGTRWSASELILLLALYVDNTGHAGGLVVIDYDTIGALCSMPAATVAECCDTLDAGKAIKYDNETGEACVFSRLAHATKKEQLEIQKSLPDIRSTTVKRATIKYIKTKFETRIQENPNKSTTSTPKEKKREEKKINKKKAEEENVNKDDLAAAADVEQENILPAGGPESCPSGALAHIEGGASTTFGDCLDRLRKNGSLVKGADLERDRCAIVDLRNLGGVLGDDIVLAVIENENYPGAALKACRAAELFEKAEVARKASSGAVGDANRAKLMAYVANLIGDPPRANGNPLENIANHKKKAAANAAGVAASYSVVTKASGALGRLLSQSEYLATALSGAGGQ